MGTNTEKDADAITRAARIEAVGRIVAAMISNGDVAKNEVSAMIDQLTKAFDGGSPLRSPPAGIANSNAAQKKTIFPDYLICLEDGRKLKMLKRHLRTEFNMTPQEYRQKWGLPGDYPMVAPKYSERRAIIAKDHGLGLNSSSSGKVVKLKKKVSTKKPAKSTSRRPTVKA